MTTFDEALESTLAEEQPTKPVDIVVLINKHEQDIKRALAKTKPPSSTILAKVLTKVARETNPTAPEVNPRTLRRHLRALGLLAKRGKRTSPRTPSVKGKNSPQVEKITPTVLPSPVPGPNGAPGAPAPTHRQMHIRPVGLPKLVS